MIELVKGDTIIKTPNELTVELYQKIQNNPKCLEDPIELICEFTGLNRDEIKNQKKKTIELLSSFVAQKLEQPKDKGIITTFIHNGIEYGLETDFGSLAWGAWVDLEVYSNDEKIHNNIHKILAILYRPIVSKSKDGLKYEIEPYRSESINPRSQLFLDLPLYYWFGVSRFFLDIANAYISNTETSLNQKNKLNRLMLMGMKILPKWVQKKLLRGSILNLPTF